MKRTEKDGEIILSDVPITKWAFGLLLFLGGMIFVAALLIGKGRNSNSPVDFGQIFCLSIAGFAFYGAYSKLSSPIIITRINKVAKTVEITSWTFGIKKTEKLSFSKIKRFEMVRRKYDRSYLFYNVVTLQDGSQIDLESSGNASGNICLIASRMNELLKTSQSHTSTKKLKESE